MNAASPDYEDLLLNLYQPVFQNALGRCLLGRDVLELSITAEERAELHRRLSPLSSNGLRRGGEQGRWLKPSGCPPWPVICTSRRGRCCLGSRWRWSMTA